MIIYQFNPTREFIGSANAHQVRGEFIIPARATQLKPPAAKTGKARVFKQGAWTYVDDHRGQTVWDIKTQTKRIVDALGELPEGTTPLVPLSAKEGAVVSFKNGEWTYVEDHRGQTVWDIKTQAPSEVNYLGAIKKGYADIEPPEFSGWDGKRWVLDKALQLKTTKAQKYRAIDAWRDARLYADIKFKRNAYQANALSQTLINNALTVFSVEKKVPEGFVWRDAQNRNHPFSLDDLLSLGAAIANRTNAVYAQSWALKAQLDKAKTRAEIDKVSLE